MRALTALFALPVFGPHGLLRSRYTRLHGINRSAYLRVILGTLARTMRDWQQTRRGERELLALDDRYLRDIGISRSDVTRAVRGLHRHSAGPTCVRALQL